MLEQHLDMAQACVLQVRQEGRQALSPGVDLRDTGACVEPDPRLLGEQLVQLVGFGSLEQDVGTVTDQGHSNFPHEACVIGMRVGATTSRRLGARRAASSTVGMSE